jgi:hypothetical protein
MEKEINTWDKLWKYAIHCEAIEEHEDWRK